MNTKDAERVVEWCGSLERDQQGRAIVIQCPAHPLQGNARVAKVALDFKKENVVIVCRTFGTGSTDDGEPCKAAADNRICYHALAAIIFRAWEVGSRVWFYSSEYETNARSNAAKYGSFCFAITCGDKTTGFAVIEKPKREREAQPQPAKQESPTVIPPVEDPVSKMAGVIASLTEQLGKLDGLPEQLKTLNEEVIQLRQRVGVVEEARPRRKRA